MLTRAVEVKRRAWAASLEDGCSSDAGDFRGDRLEGRRSSGARRGGRRACSGAVGAVGVEGKPEALDVETESSSTGERKV